MISTMTHALVTLLTAAALIASAIASDGLPPMAIEKVGQDVYVVRGQAGQASAANAGFISNAGAVATGEGLVVFDTLGTPALGAKMRKLLEEASGEKVKLVVVSHYHADHFYGIQAFQGPGVEIIAHPNAEQVFAAGDKVIVVGTDDGVEAAAQLLAGR